MGVGPFLLQVGAVLRQEQRRGVCSRTVQGGLAELLRCQFTLPRFTLPPWKHAERFHFAPVLGVRVLLTQLSAADRGEADHLAFKTFQEFRQ